MKRVLAAILYADIPDFGRQTGCDEEGTFRVLKTSLDNLTAAIEGEGGRVVNYAAAPFLDRS